MRIDRLVIHHLRNLEQVRLDGLGGMNLIYGENGAGKTSLLESAHLVFEGRSFRHGAIQPLVAKGAKECTVFAEVSDCAGGQRHTVGVAKRRGGGSEIRLDREKEISALDLTRLGVVQTLAQEHGDLFHGGPDVRRRFLDWGLFHVEHRFLDVWRRFQSTLRQRNSLLRRGRIRESELRAWDREFIAASSELDQMRQEHVSALLGAVPEVLVCLLDQKIQVALTYYRGWDDDTELEEALLKRMSTDLERGFTSCGPHRADLKVSGNLGNVTNTLSRGQRKLAGWGLRIAHAKLVEKLSQKSCVYLVDDLHAELSPGNSMKLASLLVETGAQCFISTAVGVDSDPCKALYPNPCMFHVEHGQVNAC